MPYREKVKVTEIKADFDPFGGEYVQVAFGYDLPAPKNTPFSAPQGRFLKHAIHVIFPKEKWVNQYAMWDELWLVIQDDGTLMLSEKEGQ